MKQLGELHENLAQFDEVGATVLAVGPQSQADMQKGLAKLNLGFEVYSDSDAAMIKALGLVNESISEQMVERFGTVPHPAAIVVAPDGTVKKFRVDEVYVKRPSPAELLEALASD